MGANTQEYNKSLVDRLEEEHEKSYLGKKYQTLGQKMGPVGMIGSALAPAIGGMAGTTLNNMGNLDLGSAATIGGSAIGALAAPIMYRSMQKQNISNIKSMQSRNDDLKNGQTLSSSQTTDSVLNAGKSIKNTAMGGMAATYGINALTGGGLNPAAMFALGKGSAAFGNIGSAGFMAANQLAGAHYLNPIMGEGHTHMSALLGKGISGVGSTLNHFGMTGTGTSLVNAGTGLSNATGMAGLIPGMMAYMLATAGGSKLTKSIKSMATDKDTKKYHYKVSDLGNPASKERDVEKYDTMKTVSAQINLLTVTGQLTPYESLSLGYFQSIDKHVLFLNAIYDLLSDDEKNKKDDHENLYSTHNEIGDLIGQYDGDKLLKSSKNSYMNSQPENYFERTGTRATEIFDNLKKSTHNLSTDISAFADVLNPIKILTGGLLGTSSTKDVKALYKTEDDYKKADSINESASDLNIPSNIMQLAEMDITRVMKLSDTVEGKQLAVQAFNASLTQSLLQLQLDNRKTEDGKGFFNRTQRHLDEKGHTSWFDKLKDAGSNAIGAIPLLNVVSGVRAILKGRESRNKYQDEANEASFVDSASLMESSKSKKDDFMSYQFPKLFLDNLSLDDERNKILKVLLTGDEERNKILKSLLKLNDPDEINTKNNKKDRKELYGANTYDKKIKKSLYGVYDTIKHTIGSANDARRSIVGEFHDKSEKIHNLYKNAIEKDPKNKKHYEEQLAAEITELKENAKTKTEQTTSNLGSVGSNQEKEKDKRYKSLMLKAFEAIAKEHNEKIKPENNAIDQTKGVVKKTTIKAGSLLKDAFKGLGKLGDGLLGLLTGGFTNDLSRRGLIRGALTSTLSWAMQHKKTSALIAAAGIGYLAYEASDTVKKSIDKFTSYFSGTVTDKKGKKKLSALQYTGQIMGLVGDALMMYAPTPIGKGVGAIIALAGYGMAANWKKIMQDMAIKHPEIESLMSHFISDKTLKSWGISPKQLEIKREKIAEKQAQVAATKDFYAKHQTFTNSNVKQLEAKLDVIKDVKEKDRLKKLVEKLDNNKDGKIDEKDRKGHEKEFLKIQQEIRKDMTEHSKKLLESYEAVAQLSTATIAEKRKAAAEFVAGTKNFNLVVEKLNDQIDSTKVNLTAISKKDSLGSWGLTK